MKDLLPVSAPVSLDREHMEAVNALHGRADFDLDRLGISQFTVWRCGGLGLGRVRLCQELYEPAQRGDWMNILPIYWPYTPHPNCDEPEPPDLEDLIAFDPREPGRWFYRIGQYDHILGADQMTGGSVQCNATPLDWLRAECRGVVHLGALERLTA